MSHIDLIQTQHEFLTNLQTAGKSFNTVKNYRADLQVFNDFITRAGRPLILQGFTLTQVNEYADYLEKKYSSSNSIRRRVQALRLYFDYLVVNAHFPENPIRMIPVAPKVLDAPTPTPFIDILKLTQHLQTRIKQTEGLERLLFLRNHLLVCLIYEAGLKVSDIAQLEWDNFLPSEKSSIGMRVMIQPPKRDPYSVPLSTTFRKIYTSYVQELAQAYAAHGVNSESLLFNANPYRILSGGLSPRGTELVFEEFRRSLKIDITARSLRQSAIFKWLNLNRTESQIKEWLGVAPDYDLKPYVELWQKNTADYIFVELPDEP